MEAAIYRLRGLDAALTPLVPLTLPKVLEVVVVAARAANPAAEERVRDTTGVMPWSKSVFHCVARVPGGDCRRAGRVTRVVERFVPGCVN